MEWQDDE